MMNHDLHHCSLAEKWYVGIFIVFVILMVSFPGFSEEKSSPSGQRIEDKNKKKRRLLEELLVMMLPTTQRMGELEISLNPRLDDTALKDHIRMPLRFKYGFTPNLEFSCRLNNFLDNPFRNNGSNGISTISFQGKYQWKRYLRPHLNTATAFSIQIPTDDDFDIDDGYTHYRPQFIFSKTLQNRHEVHLSTAISLDILSSFPEKKIIPGETQGYNSLGLTIGLLYPAQYYNCSVEVSWITTEIDGGTQNAVFVTPGLLWHIPKRGHPGVPGKFRLALGVRVGLHDVKDDFIIIARIKWDLQLKRRKRGSVQDKGPRDEHHLP